MGKDAYDLLWEGDARAPRGRPAGLSRARIVEVALDIADSEGLQKVSMKRIAERLDSGVMSLYRHVPGKDQLVALMLDTAIGQAPELPLDRGWREGLKAWAHANRDFFLAHPWALSLATQNRPIGPNEMTWLDRALGTMADLNLNAAERIVTVLTVNGYVRGGIQRHLAEPEETGPQWFRSIEGTEGRERFPHVSALLADGSMEGPLPDEFFDFGLERVLDGIERYIEGAADRA